MIIIIIVLQCYCCSGDYANALLYYEHGITSQVSMYVYNTVDMSLLYTFSINSGAYYAVHFFTCYCTVLYTFHPLVASYQIYSYVVVCYV